MAQYFLLGTSHECQDEAVAMKAMAEVLGGRAIGCVAEEYPFDTKSKARELAEANRLPWIQVDPLPGEWRGLGIEAELDLRQNLFPHSDVRLAHADAVRERIWLDRIEADAGDRRVLLV
jgi:hypothetical protein